jgi:hypothetical protein
LVVDVPEPANGLKCVVRIAIPRIGVETTAASFQIIPGESFFHAWYSSCHDG